MLRNEDPGAGGFSTNGHALEDPHQQEKQGRGHPDRLIGWEKPNEKGRNCHKQDAERKHAFTSMSVTEMRHDDATDRPRQIASGKDTKSLSLANPIRQACGKEQLTDYGGEEHEDDEVIKLQRTPD